MTSPKFKKQSSGNSAGKAQQFFIWHGEKIVVGIVVVAALYLAWQGLDYKTLSWTPKVLEDVARDAEEKIKDSTLSAKDVGVEYVEYSTHATQIRSPIPAEPYMSVSLWHPPFGFIPPSPPRTQSSGMPPVELPKDSDTEGSSTLPSDQPSEYTEDLPEDEARSQGSDE